MTCPICGFQAEKLEPARHLPHFVRCPNCTGYSTQEKGTASYPQTYFAEEPERQKKSFFSPLLDFFLWLRMRKSMRMLGGKSGTILDYGCGNGKLISYLRKHGFDAEGYDPESSAVALARRAGLPVFGAVPDKTYDLIMFWHSLEHSDTPLRDMAAVKHRLKPDGRVLIAVPNGNSLEVRFFGESFFCYDWPFHRVHFTPRALTALLQKAGFSVLSLDYFNPEYTLSALTQTFLNLLMPKNALYSLVSARRSDVSRNKLMLLSMFSMLLLVLFLPVLLVFFVIELITKRTAAFIAVAELS